MVHLISVVVGNFVYHFSRIMVLGIVNTKYSVTQLCPILKTQEYVDLNRVVI